MSVKNKIITTLVVSIILMVSISSFMAYYQARQALQKNYALNANAQLERVNSYILKFINDGINIVDFLSKSPLVLESKDKLSSYMNTTKEEDTNYEKMNAYEKELFNSFVVFNKTFSEYAIIYMGLNDGSFVQAPNDVLPAGYDPRTRSWFKSAVENKGKPVLSEGYISTNGLIVYSISKTITNSANDIIGVMAIDIDIADLSKFFQNIKIGKTGHILIVEPNGNIISDADNPKNVGKNVSELNRPDMLEFLKKTTGTGEVIIDGESHLASIFTTPYGWKLLMLIDTDEVTGSAWNMVRNTVIVSIITALIIVLCGLFIANSITNPLKIMGNAAKSIADGHFDAIPRQSTFSGEIHDLHMNLLAMTDQLVKLVDTANTKSAEAQKSLDASKIATEEANQAKQKAEQAHSEGMHVAANSLIKVVAVINNVSQKLSDQINTSEQRVSEQASRISETATAIEEMNNTVLDVARNAGTASEVSLQTRNLAEDGSKIVQNVVKSIKMVESDALNLKTDMDALTHHAQAISQIMNVISDIADQTNLLALNAAIEAARAGDAGRGFAVVADEVRKLAEKTMSSTTDVASAIKVIQQSANKSMSQVDATVDNIEKATLEANKSGQALVEIVSMVDKSSDQVRAIATASEQQSATSNNIYRSINQVNEIATETSKNMYEAAKEVNDLVEQTDVLSKLIDDMKKA